MTAIPAPNDGGGQTAPPRSISDLTMLVETEARLDRALAAAHATATAAVEAARQRADAATATVDGEIEHARARIATEIASATAAQCRALTEQAHRQAARFDAMRGDPLDAIALALARRLAAIALDEAAA
jgi:hypothetical protein